MPKNRQGGRLAGPAWEFIPIHEINLYVFCRSDDVLATKDVVEFDDLEGRDLILTEADEWFNDGALGFTEKVGVHVHPIRACKQIDLYQQAVTDTGGILIGTEYLPCYPEDHIAMIPLHHDSGISVVGLYSRRADRKPCVENFLRQWRNANEKQTG
jgi:hypothetical protein